MSGIALAVIGGTGEEITMAEVLANVEAASSGLPELIGELARG